MCGIYFSLSCTVPYAPDHETTSALRSRGPDGFETVTTHVTTKHPYRKRNLIFCSSVLALRGNHTQEQPLVDATTGSILCWNGEAWKKDGRRLSGNDSTVVFNSLVAAAVTEPPPSCIVEVLTSITGPFAFVFYDGVSSILYYGRDRLGRRSLILQQENPDHLTVCSVATSSSAPPKEVGVDTVHYLSLHDGDTQIQQVPWSTSPFLINAGIPNGAVTTPGPQSRTTIALLEQLSESLKLRILNIPDHNKCLNQVQTTRLAVLFSGGLDCTLLACLAHKILPSSSPIDLLNVAFENPRAMKAKAKDESPYETCPDRITGRNSFAELVSMCPGRRWRFVAIDIPYTELLAHRSTVIRLMKPHNTEMDLSITMALYFAARGDGRATVSLDTAQHPRPYITPARVLLSGLGADELFGGYARHAAAFERNGFSGLVDELSLDFSRIGERNLGRDDRVISHWGKEVRYPYLDEDFVQFALDLPVWEKCGFRPGSKTPKHYEQISNAAKIEDLEPSKLLLRTALWTLGMETAASERKRAIQFGARTAKMDLTSGKRKGTEALAVD